MRVKLFIAILAGLVLCGTASLANLIQFSGAGGAAAPFSVVAHVAAQSTDTNNVTSVAIDTSGCTPHCLIVVGVSAFPGGTVPTSISDNQSNTYTASSAQTDSAGNWHKFWYKADPTVGASHTFSTVGGAGGDFPGICAIVVKDTTGVPVTPFDTGNGATANPAAVTSLANGSITPTANNEILIAGLQFASTGTVSIDSGLTITDKLNVVASTAEGTACAYLIQTTAGAVNATWTFPSSTATTQILSFKP